MSLPPPSKMLTLSTKAATKSAASSAMTRYMPARVKRYESGMSKDCESRAGVLGPKLMPQYSGSERI